MWLLRAAIWEYSENITRVRVFLFYFIYTSYYIVYDWALASRDFGILRKHHAECGLFNITYYTIVYN